MLRENPPPSHVDKTSHVDMACRIACRIACRLMTHLRETQLMSHVATKQSTSTEKPLRISKQCTQLHTNFTTRVVNCSVHREACVILKVCTQLHNYVFPPFSPVSQSGQRSVWASESRAPSCIPQLWPLVCDEGEREALARYAPLPPSSSLDACCRAAQEALEAVPLYAPPPPPFVTHRHSLCRARRPRCCTPAWTA